MKTCLLVLDKPDIDDTDEDIVVEKESAFEELEMLVEPIDNARGRTGVLYIHVRL